MLVGTANDRAASEVIDDSPANTSLTLSNNSVEELQTTGCDDTGSTGTKRSSSSDSPVAKRQQRQRKREQDKLAAVKYRNRKKQEILTLDKQQTKLEQENIELFKQVKSAEEEVVMLKSLLREIYAPCNHGNPPTTSNVTMQSSATVVSNNVASLTSGSHNTTTSSTSGSVKTSDSSSFSNLTNTPQGGEINTTNYDNDLFSIMWNELFPL